MYHFSIYWILLISHQFAQKSMYILYLIGWVSVTPFKDDICDVQAWTPESRGIYIRIPSLLRYAINQRGPRIKYTPTYYPKRE